MVILTIRETMVLRIVALFFGKAVRKSSQIGQIDTFHNILYNILNIKEYRFSCERIE